MNGLESREHDPGIVHLLPQEMLTAPSGEQVCALLRETLAHGTAGQPLSARLLWARWKPRTALSTVHAVACDDGQTRLVTLRRHQGGKSGGRIEDRAAELAAPWQPMALTADGALISVWPHDGELPGLPRALDLARLSRALEETALAAGGNIRRRRSSVSLLRYKPSRRAVLKLDLVLRDQNEQLFERQAILRVLTPEAAAASARQRAALPSGFAPRIWLHEERTGLIVEEFVAAKLAFGVLNDDLLDRLAMERAAALRVAQGAPVKSGAAEEWIEDETASLLALFAVDPELHARTARLLARHARRRAALTRVHGDYHPGQIALTDDGRTVVYDWDECRMDEVCTDAATWAAERMRTLDAEAGEALLDRLLKADAGLDERQLRERVVMELLRKAAGSIRRLELGAVSFARNMTDLAEKVRPDAGSVPVGGDLLLPALLHATVDEADVERVEVRKDGVLLLTTRSFEALLVQGRRVARFSLAEDSDLPAAERMAARVAAGSARIVSWRPGRRLVVVGADQGRKVYWKCTKRDGAVDLHVQHEMHRPQLEMCGWQVPRLMSVDRAFDICTMEAVEGEPWRWDHVEQAQRVAQLLRCWRESGGTGGQSVHDARAEYATCERFVARLTAAGAELDWSARRVLAQLRALVVLDTSPRCNVHRDFYEKQVLIHGEVCTLLDLDLAGQGAPEQDPTNALLHARMAAVLGECDARGQQEAERAFLSVLGSDTKTKQWQLWMALNSLRMALVHMPRPRTRHAVPFLLRTAAEATAQLDS
jgi:hypothetical protein